MEVVALRHAHVNKPNVFDGIGDPSLDQIGRRQSFALIPQLAQLGVTHIYTSYAARTMETALPAATTLQLPIQPLRGLGEAYWASLAGTPINEHFTEQEDRVAAAAGWEYQAVAYAEIRCQIGLRMLNQVHNVIAELPADAKPAFVGHGIALRYMLGMDSHMKAEAARRLPMPNALPVRYGTGTHSFTYLPTA